MSIKIITTAICPFCIAAKRLLSARNLQWEEISVDHDPELRQGLSRENGGWRTVPMIFIDEEFIGGYSELRQLDESGELRERLSA